MGTGAPIPDHRSLNGNIYQREAQVPKTPDRSGNPIYLNSNQGDALRVLFVCSSGILRAPTAAHWAVDRFGWNTRSAGLANESVPAVTSILLKWADHIYVFEEKHQLELLAWYEDLDILDKMQILNIKDDFVYNDPDLIDLLERAKWLQTHSTR